MSESVSITFDPPVRISVCFRDGVFQYTETVNPDGSVTWDFREPDARNLPKCDITIVSFEPE